MAHRRVRLWKHTGFDRPIYDTVDDEISIYNGRYFVNTEQRLNDEASSTGNGFTDRAMRAFKHSGFEGPVSTTAATPTVPTRPAIRTRRWGGRTTNSAHTSTPDRALVRCKHVLELGGFSPRAWR